MRGSTTTAREFDRCLGSLAEIVAFLDEVLPRGSLDARGHFVVHLAVEELFTNMVKYNSGSSSRIAVRVTTDDERVRVDIVDPDTDPFDPTQVPAVDTTRPIEQRQQGGLGLHLIRSMADGLDHQYRGREMTVSVTKHLE